MAFWKPGSVQPGSSADRSTDASSISFPSTTVSTTTRHRLPVYAVRNHILYLLEHHRVLILTGDTGSGKTTQVPQYLYEAGWTEGGRVVGCTQPRRLAATSIATHVAHHAHASSPGTTVGYSVRFEDCSDPHHTRIKYLTDGMLLRECLIDPHLSRYSVIIVDEAHERSLHSDLCLALLKKIMRRRNDLRIILASASLHTHAFLRYFHEYAPAVLAIPGRSFPVDIHFLAQPANDYIKASVDLALEIHRKEGQGDILIFLTGQNEIDTVVERLNAHAKRFTSSQLKLMAVPLHASLSMAAQQRAFELAPVNTRKVIVSTNLAETSVTIENIVYVIDCGFVKASAQQRAGRAGRTKPGKAYRLYTQETFESLADHSTPEIQRSDLTMLLLQLKSLGIENLPSFDFLSPPPAVNMARALDLLFSISAISSSAALTPLGSWMADIPIDPFMAACLYKSAEMKCSHEMLTIAAMLCVQDVFIHHDRTEEMRMKFAVEEGDHITYLNIYESFLREQSSPKWTHRHLLNLTSLHRVSSIRRQLERYLKRAGLQVVSCGRNVEVVVKCLVSGFFTRCAKVGYDGTYRFLKHSETEEAKELHIHPSSVLFRRVPGWVIFNEVVESDKLYMRDVTVIQPEWLPEMAPHFYEMRRK